MQAQTIEKTQLSSSASYEFIREEDLASLVITSQILAGSRILMSTYRHVVFSDCVFYACSFEGVVFDNCIFENCSFEFTHLNNCKFNNCNFSDCKWGASSSMASSYLNCDLDPELVMVLKNGPNTISSVVDNVDLSTDFYIQLAVA